MEVALGRPPLPELELLVGVLDLDDRAVDEDADGDRDPGEGHDVEVSPSRWNGMNARTTEIGIVRIGTIADGKCQRKNRMTSETTMISSTSSSLRVAMDRSMRSERS